MEYYLLPAITFGIGVWMITARKEGDKNASGIKSPLIEVAAIMLPQRSLGKIRFAGMLILIASLGWMYMIWSSRIHVETSFSGVSMAGVTFQTGEWNPRVIDLRTSNTMGIHAEPGISLELFDVQAFAPESLGGGFFVQAEVFADETVYLGKTEAVALVPGAVVSLGMVKPESFQDPKVKDAWTVADEWQKILFKLEILARKGGDPLAVVNYYVQLSDHTDSWYIHPPYGNISSIVYSVNQGPELVLDLRTAGTEGIDVKIGDKLKLQEVWVKSLQDFDGQLAQVEARLGSDEYDESSLIFSDQMLFKTGVTDLVTDDRFQWTVDPGQSSIIVTLAREDGTLLDRYIIPFKLNQSADLLRADTVIAWPQDLIRYMDFEGPAALDVWSTGWGDGEPATLSLSDQKAFSGGHSAAVTVIDDGQKAFMMYNQPVKADYLLGQVFWPKQDGISVNWAQVCLGQSGECVAVPLKVDRWNTFVFDLSQPTADGTPQKPMDVPNFYIQGHIIGPSSSNPYTFYMDGVQIYPLSNP